jgi:hypothetical protein
MTATRDSIATSDWNTFTAGTAARSSFQRDDTLATKRRKVTVFLQIHRKQISDKSGNRSPEPDLPDHDVLAIKGTQRGGF